MALCPSAHWPGFTVLMAISPLYWWLKRRAFWPLMLRTNTSAARVRAHIIRYFAAYRRTRWKVVGAQSKGSLLFRRYARQCPLYDNWRANFDQVSDRSSPHCAPRGLKRPVTTPWPFSMTIEPAS